MRGADRAKGERANAHAYNLGNIWLDECAVDFWGKPSAEKRRKGVAFLQSMENAKSKKVAKGGGRPAVTLILATRRIKKGKEIQLDFDVSRPHDQQSYAQQQVAPSANWQTVGN